VTHFFEAETVKDRLAATNDDKSLDVLQSFQENLHLSVKSSENSWYQLR